MNPRRVALCLALALPFSASQSQTAADSLRLPDLRTAAAANDPRAAQLELLASQSALRLSNIDADLRPTLSIESQAQYQSDVASFPLKLQGISLPTPPHDAYDAKLGAQERLYDPSLAPRRALERAQMAESQARVRSALYSISESVNGAFFLALRSQTQIAELQTAVTDLQAQLTVANERLAAGTALPSESNLLRAEMMRRRQAIAEQTAARKAALAVLSDLTGRKIDPSIRLVSPDLAAETSNARDGIAALRARPEYDQFARARESLARAEDVRAAQDKPRIVAFGRAGYGRPGLNPLGNKFDTYWLGGVQLQWTPWNWGSTRRDRQISALQRQIVTTEEQAFTAQLTRGIEQDIASIDRLESALSEDEQIIALRENILAETRARYSESVVTSAEYVDRQTDALSARLNRAAHRVELAQARAHLLTTLGVEVR